MSVPDELQTSFTLTQGRASLEILPQAGGAVRSWRFDQKEIFSPQRKILQDTQLVAAYPVVPYAGPIAQGRFSFGENDFQLAPDGEGACAPADGNGCKNPWKLAHKTDTHAILFFDFVPQSISDTDWPFSYRAVVSYRLYEKALEIEMVLENRDTQSQPVGFGFQSFLCADSASTLSFSSQSVWTDKDGLPDKVLPAEGEWSFSKDVAFYERSLGHVFTEVGGEILLKRGGGGPDVKLVSDSIFAFLSVFSPRESDFIALSPVTMMADGFNHPEIEKRGVRVLKAGQRIGGKMRFTLTDN